MSDLAEVLKQGSLDDAKSVADDHGVNEQLRQELTRRQVKRLADAAERDQSPIEVLSETDFDALPAAKFLVPGLILEASLGMIVGEPGSLKTFTALDLALCLASGQSMWLGRKVTRHGSVVYVLGEGQGRFKYRKDLWKQEHQVTGALPFYIVRKPLNLRDGRMMADFLKQVEALSPILIFFDTMNRNLPGTEENSAKELGEAIAAAGILQQATGASVQLLHHPTKDGTSARGSGAGLGAADSELWMKKGAAKHLFTLSVGKEKEADDSLVINLKKRVVELDGVFENGEPVTSCVVELADATDLQKAASSLEMLILECVQKNPDIQKGWVHTKIGKRKADVSNAIGELLREGRLTSVKKGKSERLTFVSFAVPNGNVPF